MRATIDGPATGSTAERGVGGMPYSGTRLRAAPAVRVAILPQRGALEFGTSGVSPPLPLTRFRCPRRFCS
jgi:hypothetical protein